MSENKEFPIPFDESRRGRRETREVKSIGRRALGRAIGVPSIGDGRNRRQGINVDAPTGGKPGNRKPTGTMRDIDKDGWVDEGSTNPRWVGVGNNANTARDSSTRQSFSSGRTERISVNTGIYDNDTRPSTPREPSKLLRKSSEGKESSAIELNNKTYDIKVEQDENGDFSLFIQNDDGEKLAELIFDGNPLPSENQDSTWSPSPVIKNISAQQDAQKNGALEALLDSALINNPKGVINASGDAREWFDYVTNGMNADRGSRKVGFFGKFKNGEDVRKDGDYVFSSQLRLRPETASSKLIDEDGSGMGEQPYVWTGNIFNIDGELIAFGAHEDADFENASIKTMPLNPFEISGLDPRSEDGRALADKWMSAIHGLKISIINDEQKTSESSYATALLYAASKGDKEAKNELDYWAKKSEEFLKKLEDMEPGVENAEKALSLDSRLIHQTSHKPTIDEDGYLVLRPLEDFRQKARDGSELTVNRTTTHWAINHLAEGHMFRTETQGKSYIVIAPLGSLIEQNPNSLDNLSVVDTAITPPPGDGIRMAPGTFKVIEVSEDENGRQIVENELKEEGVDIFVGGDRSSGTPKADENTAIRAKLLGVPAMVASDLPLTTYEIINRTNIQDAQRQSDVPANTSIMQTASKNTRLRMANRKENRWVSFNKETQMSNSLLSGKAPRYPRPPAYGPLIGGAEEYFDGVKNWEEFAERYRGRDIVWIDYETTGLVFDEFGKSSSNGKPVQLGAVKVRDGKIVDRFNMFMNPGEPLGEWSRENLRGPDGERLTDDWLAGQMSIEEAHRAFSEFAGSEAILGLQNAAFDKNVLEDELRDAEISWEPSGYIDTMDMSAMTLPRWTPENPEGPSMVGRDGERVASSSLKAITEYLGVDLGDKHHTADADAEAAAMVMENLIAGAIEKGWSAGAIDRETRTEFVEKRRKDFEDKVSKFEEEKEQYLKQVAEQGGSDSLSSGRNASDKKIYKYGQKSDDGKELRKTQSDWLKGLSSKQIANLVVPESENQHMNMLLDDYLPNGDNEAAGFVEALKKNLLERLGKSPWSRGDYSPEAIERMREVVEASLNSSPKLKWAFENFGAPSFVMMTKAGADAYENQPHVRAKKEQLMSARSMKNEPFVMALQMADMDLIVFNRKQVVDQLTNDPDFEKSPLVSDANHTVRPGRANIDVSSSATLSHEYGHWLHMKAMRESERTGSSVTGARFGREQITESRMPRVVSVAEKYNSKDMDEMMGNAYRSSIPMDRTPGIPRTLTSYAHTNGREMLAEGLSAFFHPSENVQKNAINETLRRDILELLGLEPDDAPWEK